MGGVAASVSGISMITFCTMHLQAMQEFTS